MFFWTKQVAQAVQTQGGKEMDFISMGGAVKNCDTLLPQVVYSGG